MRFEELPDEHYFIFKGKPHRAYQKIAKVKECTVYSIKSKALSASISNLGFEYRYDNSLLKS